MNAAQLRRGRERADFTIIDTAPSGIDMSRVWDTEAVSSAVTDSFVLITQADARTKAFKAVLDVLEESGVGSFETTIQRREPSASPSAPVPPIVQTTSLLLLNSWRL